MSEKEFYPDRMTYSESRTINIGQYENIHSSFSYTSNLKSYNRQDNTVSISHSESESIKDNVKNFEDNAKLLMKRVKKVLNTREREVRLAVMDFVTDNELELKTPLEKDCLINRKS